MLPGEKSLLSELRRKTTWERWGSLVSVVSEEAKEVIEAFKVLHADSEKKVLPSSQLRQYTESLGTVKLSEPLGPSASSEKVERIVVDIGVSHLLDQLEKRRERGERLTGKDTASLSQWLRQVQPNRGSGNHLPPPLSLQDLLAGKSWETRGTIPTYLHRGLDGYLGGGIGRGQLCVLQAPFKKGKTTLLLTISYRAARKYSTLFVSCENYLDQLGERLSQIHQLSRRKRPPALQIAYNGHLGIEEVRSYLVKSKKKVDFLVVDYEGKMRASVENDWTWKTTEIYNGLRALADEFNLVCWTATQEHEQPDWVRESSRGGTFGSKTKGQLADLLLGVHVSPRMNQATFTVLGRRGRGKEGGRFSALFDLDQAILKEK